MLANQSTTPGTNAERPEAWYLEQRLFLAQNIRSTQVQFQSIPYVKLVCVGIMLLGGIAAIGLVDMPHLTLLTRQNVRVLHWWHD